MPYLNVVSRILAFADVSPNSNPQRRLVDWSRNLLSIPVSRPLNQIIELEPLEEVQVFSGTRTLAYDGTSEFVLASLQGSPNIYRLTWDGTGTAPVFRTDRTPYILNQSAGASGGPNFGYIAITPQANQTVLVTNPDCDGIPISTWAGVQVGDNVYLPGVTTGDTAVFDSMNEGLWIVLGVTSTQLTLGRIPGTVYSASTTNDIQIIYDASAFQVFSSSGVQVGDTLDLISGFSSQALRSYEIVSVTPIRVDFISSLPLAGQTVIPGLNSFNIYSSMKKFIGIETDQEISLKLNGNTDETCRVEPILANCGDKVGLFAKFGTVYSLSLCNRSTSVATVTLISTE